MKFQIAPSMKRIGGYPNKIARVIVKKKNIPNEKKKKSICVTDGFRGDSLCAFRSISNVTHLCVDTTSANQESTILLGLARAARRSSVRTTHLAARYAVAVTYLCICLVLFITLMRSCWFFVNYFADCSFRIKWWAIRIVQARLWTRAARQGWVSWRCVAWWCVKSFSFTRDGSVSFFFLFFS